MKPQEKVLKLLEVVYGNVTESIAFPTSYKAALEAYTESSERSIGNRLASFLIIEACIEACEVMEGQETFEGCKHEVVLTIEGAICELNLVKSALLARNETDADLLAKCENCRAVFEMSALNPIRDLYQRVEPGEPMPAGECPRCGALCHTIDDESTNVAHAYADGQLE